jgi:hypothetical protein
MSSFSIICATSVRQQSRTSLLELLRRRIHGLACGYPDANDAARLEVDLMLKKLAGRDPLSGCDLASQSTL